MADLEVQEKGRENILSLKESMARINTRRKSSSILHRYSC